MLSRHLIDRSTIFEFNDDEPQEKIIEDIIFSESSPTDEVNHHTILKEPYLPEKKLIEAVNMAIKLGRPLLVQGDPGCGKTRLAYAVAYSLGLPLEECYIKSTSKAQDLLYTYDAISRLYDAQLGKNGPKDKKKIPLCKNPVNYIHLGPLGRAIARTHKKRRSVVLIDEIDKADFDFPNDLLMELDNLEFFISEANNLRYFVPKDKPELRPIVIITHNEEKALPAAFLRRCVYYYLDFPNDKEFLKRIFYLHKVSNVQLGDEAIRILLLLRGQTYEKNPGISELIDWVIINQENNTYIDELKNLPNKGVLFKNKSDQIKAVEDLKKSE